MIDLIGESNFLKWFGSVGISIKLSFLFWKTGIGKILVGLFGKAVAQVSFRFGNIG